MARQLRLRDIGGIIVIDFIDMEIRKNRDEVIRAFREALARDKTRTQVFDISELGLVEMTRKRISEGLVESSPRPAPAAVAAVSSSTSRCCKAPQVPPRVSRISRAMYAVIATGGKQYKVEEGQRARRRAARCRRGRGRAPARAPRRRRFRARHPRPARRGQREGQGRRRGQGPEDQRLHLQEQVQQPAPLGSPPEVHDDRDHRDLARAEGAPDVEEEGRRLLPQRPRLQRPAARASRCSTARS